jgi:hypothetical protein
MVVKGVQTVHALRTWLCGEEFRSMGLFNPVLVGLEVAQQSNTMVLAQFQMTNGFQRVLGMVVQSSVSQLQRQGMWMFRDTLGRQWQGPVTTNIYRDGKTLNVFDCLPREIDGEGILRVQFEVDNSWGEFYGGFQEVITDTNRTVKRVTVWNRDSSNARWQTYYHSLPSPKEFMMWDLARNLGSCIETRDGLDNGYGIAWKDGMISGLWSLQRSAWHGPAVTFGKDGHPERIDFFYRGSNVWSYLMSERSWFRFTRSEPTNEDLKGTNVLVRIPWPEPGKGHPSKEKRNATVAP